MSRLKYIFKKNRDIFMSTEFNGECPICGNGNMWVGNHSDGQVYSLNCTRCGFTAGERNTIYITFRLKLLEWKLHRSKQDN